MMFSVLMVPLTFAASWYGTIRNENHYVEILAESAGCWFFDNKFLDALFNDINL